MFKRVIITQVCTENTLLKVFEHLKISLMKKKDSHAKHKYRNYKNVTI